MIIFDSFEMSEALSVDKDDLSGFIELLDEDNFFLFFYFCLPHSMATSCVTFVSIVRVFAQVQYLLSCSHWDDSDGISEKWSEKPRRFFSSPSMSDCSFMFLRINIATGRTY